MKPTADQVIQEFDELSVEDKQRVYVTIVKRNGNVPLIQTDDPEALRKITEQLLCVPIMVRDVSNAQEESERMRGQKVLWKDILIDFIPNKYVQSYQDIWTIESILGSEAVRSSLRENRILNADFVERLFSQSTYSFYVNRSQNYLLSDANELFESDFGPLIPLTALEAVKRYSLSLLEESKEKGYVRL